MDSSRLCLDTTALIDFLKGREPGASAVDRAVRDYACHVTAVTVYELLFGVARARKAIGEEDLLGLMMVLPFDDGAARLAAQLHDDLVRRNQDIGVKDVLIAAICLTHDIPLLTLNERHFSRVRDLVVISPSALIATHP
ncbi:MAG: type II toxin-antitoxin system VapC family toxin [Chloroflexi bacterium]|nr:type II toxin-antitoxin system VapC family toxin [Chloroflexota bacterium]